MKHALAVAQAQIRQSQFTRLRHVIDDAQLTRYAARRLERVECSACECGLQIARVHVREAQFVQGEIGAPDFHGVRIERRVDECDTEREVCGEARP